jgi:hypothetical protein
VGKAVRAGVGTAFLLLLGSCSPVFPIDVVVRDGELLFWTERSWRWFIIPERKRDEICSIEMWSDGQWVWRTRFDKVSACRASPITYGERIAGYVTETPARKLVIGRSYWVRVTGVHGEGRTGFTLSPERELVRHDPQDSPPDPHQIAYDARRKAKIAALMAQGLSREEAEQRVLMDP